MKIPGRAFNFPMKNTELLSGVIYLPVHAVVLSFLVPLLMSAAAPKAGPGWEELVYYSIGLLFILIAMHSYLLASFRTLVSERFNALTAVVVGFFGYYLLRYLLSLIFWAAKRQNFPVFSSLLSPARLNIGVFPIIVCLFAPIVEEVLYRGVVFGGLRHKNRLLAYFCAFVIFGVCSLWQSFFSAPSWGLLISFVYLLPASLSLCWCYDHGGSIWASISLHILINTLSVSVSFSG